MSWGRDDEWWSAKIAAGGPVVVALNASSALLGLLIVVALAEPRLLGDGAGRWPASDLESSVCGGRHCTLVPWDTHATRDADA